MITYEQYCERLVALQHEFPRVNDTLSALKRIEVLNAVEDLEDEWNAARRAQVDPVRMSLRRLYVNSQGYANGGRTYYGVGEPLYEATADTAYYRVLRAADREDAKAQLRHEWRARANLIFAR